MDKKIQKLQEQITKAKKVRAEDRVSYDMSVVILNGQRKTIENMEEISDNAFIRLKESDKAVDLLINELNDLEKESQEIDIENVNQ